MKKIIYSIILCAAFSFSSCSEFTELQPKGKNLLETADQLEMLLNSNLLLYSQDLKTMGGDVMYAVGNIPTMISKPVKTRDVIIWTYDEKNQDIMADLTAVDSDYSNMFSWIGTVCNPILSRVKDASGDMSQKNRIKSESLAMRAYLEYILVNKYAKAYNPATASTDPGIAYLMEDDDISLMCEKKTVQQVYDQILVDLDMALETDGLPDVAVNKMRFSKPCLYAVKALVLLSMQKYEEAESSAKAALAINNSIFNFSEHLGKYSGALGNIYDVVEKPSIVGYDEDYYMVGRLIYYHVLTPDSQARFEPGHMFLTHVPTIEMMFDNIRNTESVLGIKDCITIMDMSSYWNLYGLSSPQMYMVIAESEIEKGNYDIAMNALDKIRVGRIEPSVYVPLEGRVSTKEDAILHLKQTLHGESVYSIWDFVARKRWNQLNDYKDTYTRTIKYKDPTSEKIVENVYSITPDSPMWIFPFPKNVYDINPNMTHNYK